MEALAAIGWMLLGIVIEVSLSWCAVLDIAASSEGDGPEGPKER